MPSQRVNDILKKYGFQRNAQTSWQVQGNDVIYHHILEQIAIDLQIEWLPPQVLFASADCAVILCSATMDGKLQWSVGEAHVGVNYRVSGKQAAYPWAMAEKRAKDRVIYKFLGLQDYYDDSAAEEEAKPKPPEGQIDVSKMTVLEKFIHNLNRKATWPEVAQWLDSEPVKLALEKMNQPDRAQARASIESRRAALGGEPTSREEDISPKGKELLQKCRAALAKAKNKEEVESYRRTILETELDNESGPVLDAFARDVQARLYELDRQAG